MRERESGRVEPLIVREEGHEDRKYLSMLFSDLGDFPPLEPSASVDPVRPEIEEGDAAAADTVPVADEVVAGNGNGSGPHGHPEESLTVKPQTVRPFIEEVLNVPTAPHPGPDSRGSRWKVAAMSMAGFLAVGGTAFAVLSLGFQANARDQQVVPVRAAVLPDAAANGAEAVAVGAGANLQGFQGCTKGEGLSPMGLMLVAKDFVSTTTAPAVCLPTEAPKKKARPGANSTPAADQTAAGPSIVATTPSGSSGSGGSTPATGGGGSGGAPGTGTGGGSDPGTGTGEEPSPSPSPPPDDGGTTEPDKPGNGWGKGGKPKGTASG